MSKLSEKRKIQIAEKLEIYLDDLFKKNTEKIPLHQKYAVEIKNIGVFLKDNKIEQDHIADISEVLVNYGFKDGYLYLCEHYDELFPKVEKKSKKKTEIKANDKEPIKKENETRNLDKEKKKVIGFLKYMTTKGHKENEIKPNKEGYIDLKKLKDIATKQKKSLNWDSLDGFIKEEFEVKKNMIKISEEQIDEAKSQVEETPKHVDKPKVEGKPDGKPLAKQEAIDTKTLNNDHGSKKRKGTTPQPNAKLSRQDKSKEELEEELINFLNYGFKRCRVPEYHGYIYLEDIENNTDLTAQVIREVIVPDNAKFQFDVESDTHKPQIRIAKNRESQSDVTISKTLSSILRHNAGKYGLTLDDGGFLFVEDLLNLPDFVRKRIKETDISRIVQNNEKQRFHMTTDETTGRLKIRANQGHSLAVANLDLQEVTPETKLRSVIHGTYWKFWKYIEKEGLKRQNRNHIHFAESDPSKNQVISGMRSSCDVTIYVNWKLALADGLKFFLSANNVILSPGDENGILSPKYFEKVMDRETGKQIFPGISKK